MGKSSFAGIITASNMIEIADHTDEIMVVRVKPAFAIMWSLLLPGVYTFLFLILFLISIPSGSAGSHPDWSILIIWSIVLPLSLVYSIFVCRKMNVITFDRKEEKISVKPCFELPFMKSPESYDLSRVKMLLYGWSLQMLPCLYIMLDDDTRIPILDIRTNFKNAGSLHLDVARFLGVPYTSALPDRYSPLMFLRKRSPNG